MEVCGLTEALFPALTGGWFVMFMATFSYVGDITSVERRTLRIGIVNVFVSLGIPIGMALSGVLYNKIGFYGVFGISASLYVASFVYGALFIAESGTCESHNNSLANVQLEKKIALGINDNNKMVQVQINEEKNIQNQEKLPSSAWAFLKDFFDLRHISDTFTVAFKRGERNRRSRVIMLMIVVMVVIGPLHGKSNIFTSPKTIIHPPPCKV